MRDYLTKNPQILVEMATQLDKRQASQQTKAISDNADAISIAGIPCGGKSKWRRECG